MVNAGGTGDRASDVDDVVWARGLGMVVVVCACACVCVCVFFFNDTATTEIYTLSLHDALPIYINIFTSYHGLWCRAFLIYKFSGLLVF